MGRRSLVVNKDKLTKAINTVEQNGPLGTQSELFNKVAELYNNDSPPEPITAPVVRLRVLDWKVDVKTQPGKRGRQKGDSFPSGNRQARSDKFKNNADIQSAFRILRANTPARFSSVLDKVVDGSMAAAIKLNCIDCCGGEGCGDEDSRSVTREIRECSVKSCPLYAFRPYQ